MYPFNVVLPPYDASKQSMIKLMATKLDLTQSQIGRRMKWFAILLILLWLIVTKRLTTKTFKKIKNVFKMALMVFRQSQ